MNPLDDSFDFFAYSRENENKLKLLRGDAENMLGDSATTVTTSGVIAAALVNGLDRIVRDDLPLDAPVDSDGEKRFEKLAIGIGRLLTCYDLEEKGMISRTSDGWVMTEKGEGTGKDIDTLIDESHFSDGNPYD
tara:strand:+ start:73255 stop:73656 length:402 start_codon:yes stop_codon:yes gene_type:complete